MINWVGLFADIRRAYSFHLASIVQESYITAGRSGGRYFKRNRLFFVNVRGADTVSSLN